MRQAVWCNAVPAVLLAAGLGSTQAATLLHDYRLNGTLADSLGGPSLTSGGGILENGGYRFQATLDSIAGIVIGQGLSLTNALDNDSRSSYSIEFHFRLDSTETWRKLVDFKNLENDNGFYNLDGCLQFDSLAKSDTALVAGQMAHMVITRNSATKSYRAYVDGVMLYSFVDDEEWASFTAPGNVVWLFQDEPFGSGTEGLENPSGFVDFVRIWQDPLTPAEVQALYQGIPEPTPTSLLMIGLFGGAWWRRRRGA